MTFPRLLTADEALAQLRDQWTMENRVFRVRDATDDEDRWSMRKIGHGVISLRIGAMLLCQPDYRSVPDAHRAIAAPPARAFVRIGVYDEDFERLENQVNTLHFC